MGALRIPKLSVDEYLAIDRVSEIPSEFHDGEMFPIEAVTLRHSLISGNTIGLLKSALAGTNCKLAVSPLRVRVSPTKFVIPDILVYCGAPQLTDEHQDTITNPKVILEVLSPSTSNYDYGGKFALYRRLESFEEYVMIAQDRPCIEVFRKTSDKRWLLSTYEGLENTAPVDSLGMSLPLGDVYAGTDFPPGGLE